MNRFTLFAMLASIFAFSSLSDAAEIRTYSFTADAEPHFRYVSGDLICEVAAQLTGEFTIAFEESSGEATLRLSGVTLGPTHTEAFGEPFAYGEGHFCNDFSDSLDSALLTESMPGVDIAISGARVSATEFQFGPILTDDRFFMREITLRESGSSASLSGSSVFYGTDGPSYFLQGSLVRVPELATLSLSAIAVGVTLISQRRRYLRG